MKRKNLLVLLTTVCLFSCQQQNEQQELSKEAINFSTSIDNESVTDILTRSSSTLSLPVKDCFTTGDVISMSISEQEYIPFTLGMDNCTWDEIGVNSETVTFYAHYPELSDTPSTRSFGKPYREIKGGKEFLFGTASASPWSKNVSLNFKRMTVPVILLDENDRPYDGGATVKLFMKNQGVQNLFDGAIQIAENAKTEEIIIKKTSEGSLTNLIPQSIQAGKIGEVIVGGEKQDIIAEQDVNLNAGRALTMRAYRGRFTIIDERTPLRR